MNIDYPVNTLDNIKYVCIEAKYKNKWILGLHSQRETWECSGGHVEENETALDAAKRELIEETGALDFTITPLWDYQVLDNEGNIYNNGRVYYAEVTSFTSLPKNSEMKEIGFFLEIPEKTTYNRVEMIHMLIKAEKTYENIGK